MNQREGDAIAWNCLIYAILLFVILVVNSDVTQITVQNEPIVTIARIAHDTLEW